MKKVITYGTFDMFHEGHYNLINRAKELGDYLIVGVTTNNFDCGRGKLNVQDSLMKRIKSVEETNIADEIIIEEFQGQKISDILKYEVDVFAVGSDWKGKFDYLKEYCEVVYLPRTKGISSTELRNMKNSILKLGVVGAGRIANRFVPESKYVSGIEIEGIYSRRIESAEKFAQKHELNFFTDTYDELLRKVDAVYIASPHQSHYEYTKEALLNNKHVLCEKPIVLEKEQAEELYDIANKKGLVLMEGIKTAFSQGFIRLLAIAKSGVIGEIKSVEATFTKLEKENSRELNDVKYGGSVTELATYPLMGIIKLLGEDIKDVQFYSTFKEQLDVDIFTKIQILYKNKIASAKVGLGVKSEGEMIISGTKGYIYVDSPWWKTESFEVRYEDSNKNDKYFYKFEEDGLRYELVEFVSLINNKQGESFKLKQSESIRIAEIINMFMNRENVIVF